MSRARARFLDIAVVLSIALVLAGFYGSMNLRPRGFALAFPQLDGALFQITRIDYYPWPDLAENIYAAFVVEHGGRVYEYGALAHMPGVPELIGAVLTLFGFSRATPSPQTMTAAYLSASFATLAFQSACVYGPLRSLSFGPAAAAIVTLIAVASTAFAYHFAMPMSETLIAYLVIFVPLLSWRMIAAAGSADRIAAAVWLGGPVTLGCVSLGLTIGPANVVSALACLYVLIAEFWRTPRAAIETLRRDRRCWCAYFVAAAIVTATLLLSKASDLWFWAVGILWGRELLQPWSKIQQSLAVHFEEFLTLAAPIGSRYPHLLTVLAGFVIVMLIAARREGRLAASARNVALFVTLIVVIAAATQWRANTGYKSTAVFGLTVGVLVLALASLPERIRHAPSLLLAPLFALALAQWQFIPAALSYSTHAAPRLPALDEANVCRAGETRDCRCIQGTVFGPQIFLFHDMRACRDRAATFNLLLGQRAVTRTQLMNDIRVSTNAFWLHKDALMIGNGIPQEAIDYWRSEARCAAIDAEQAICFAPGPLRP